MSQNQHRWTIHVDHRVEKVLKKLPKDLFNRIDQKILSLAEDPYPPGCKKLSGHDKLFRIRVGDWRISYAVEIDLLIILVIEVAPRSRAYRF